MVISIKATADSLTVSNRIAPKKNTHDNPSGIGLQNLASRCRLACNRDITIRQEKNLFSVTIPVIP